jgi:hypothetical protein
MEMTVTKHQQWDLSAIPWDLETRVDHMPVYMYMIDLRETRGKTTNHGLNSLAPKI